MRQRVGTCSNCGGDVYGHRGPWHSIVPPPPDRCVYCGGTRGDDLIEIVPPRPRRPRGTSYETLRERAEARLADAAWTGNTSAFATARACLNALDALETR